MTPPTALLEDSTRLTLEEFGSQFAVAWSKLETRFLKVESWQRYQEIDAAESQNAYNRGDVSLARELLRREAEGDLSLYEEVRQKKIDYARLRIARRPITDYLRYELMAYAIRAEMGENIEIIEFPSTVSLPNDKYFDFLLFDRNTALIHDYGSGPVGLQSGGWLTHNQESLATLEQVALSLRERANSVQRFISAD
jgi:uncharacterized protein DUF6879